MKSILSRHGFVAEEFFVRHGDRYRVARDYWNDVKDRVQLVDVSKVVPAFSKLRLDNEPEAS